MGCITATTELPPDAVTDLVVLAFNSGSSSLKFGLYRVGKSRVETLLSGAADSIGADDGRFHAQSSQGQAEFTHAGAIPSQKEAVSLIQNYLAESSAPSPAAIGHRIVHGGPHVRQHCLIDDEILRQIERAAAFAPLHTPSALAVIRFAQDHFPGLPQVACFDTVFHAGMPDVARMLPIPRELRSEGIQRYGFHGLSCESILHQLADAVPERLIIAHLGNGASITAINGGKSIDTSMGLTPTGGVIMGTRSGDLDPGILVYLMREKKFDALMLEDMIDHRCGLLGISGFSSDMRRLHDASHASPDAELAVDMFCYSVRKQIAGMIAALGGVDTIIFTGGIGENDSEVRAAICAGLSWAGVNLDDVRNRSLSNPINDPASRVQIKVIASQEDEQIGRHTWAIAPR